MKKKVEAKQDRTRAAVVFDYPKTLVFPVREVSSFFCSVRLKTYNFTLEDFDNCSHTYYVYTEKDAKRGSCEVITFLLHYLGMLKKRGITSVEYFWNRCSGQNCNWQVFITLSYALQQLHFEEIGSNCLTSAHAKVETRAKICIIYSPHEWQTIIRNSFSEAK